MAISKISGYHLAGSIVVMPKNQEDNSNLENFTSFEKEQLILHTGIKFRRVVKKEEQIGDYFRLGIENLLKQLNWQASEIDILICVTQTLKTPIPSLSCKIQGELNFPKSTLCYDINSGCSGYVYGIHTVMSLMNTFVKKNVKALICAGDFSSQLIDRKDKSTLPIFSDAISVTGIETSENNFSSFFNLETDGSGRKAIYMSDQFMRLNGIDVFNYSLQLVPNHIAELLKVAQIEGKEEEVFIFHQANKLINEALMKRLNLNPVKVPSTLYAYGNTASASIPLTLGIYYQKEKITQAILCGFGVGFSVASALVYLCPNYSFSIIDV